MNEREIAELRRRCRPEKSSITHVCGCYVNEIGEIISEFSQSLGMMREDEADKLLAILRKILSGTLGKNLMDISFETKQVVDGEEHKLLMNLRESKLHDDEALKELYQKIIETVEIDSNYLILLTADAYDVPFRSKDGMRQNDASSEVFTYMLCAICPVKQTKPVLSYSSQENEFYNLNPNWVVSAPLAGFMFPAFDERTTNLYGALYYTKDIQNIRQPLIDRLFHTDPIMSAGEQKMTFQSILSNALEEECSYEVVQSVHDRMRDLILDHKENKEEEPLMVNKDSVRQVLESAGVGEVGAAKFSTQYDEAFGAGTDISPQNLVDHRRMEIKTPEITIKITGPNSHLVETRVIDGAKYILIRAEDLVEVDGVPIQIS